MSKREYLHRYLLIIRRLEKSEATLEELNDYLKVKSELQGDNLTISQRTFIRDRQEILSLYSINIEYDFKRKVYYITNDNHTDLSLRTLEAFELFNALKMSDSFSQFVQVEKAKPQGTEHFNTLLKAIKNRKVVALVYKKFEYDTSVEVFIEPYALKEFDGRWYLIGNVTPERKMRIYGLDRINALNVMSHKFDKPANAWNVKDYFKDYFGIFHTEDTKPEKVVLSFTPEQGRYIKTLPLHASQKIVVNNDDELKIELFLHVTYDLIKNLLSYADDVKVIAPATLKKEMIKRLRNAVKQYTSTLQEYA